MPALSPAVELAAYRIAVEGITNALRHSTGRSCRVAVNVDGGLDGAGPPAATALTPAAPRRTARP